MYSHKIAPSKHFKNLKLKPLKKNSDKVTPQKQTSTKNLKYFKTNQNQFLGGKKFDQGKEEKKLSDHEKSGSHLGAARDNFKEEKKRKKNSHDFIKEIMKRIHSNEIDGNGESELRNIEKTPVYGFMKNESIRKKLEMINGEMVSKNKSEEDPLMLKYERERFFLSEKKRGNPSQEYQKNGLLLKSLGSKQIVELKLKNKNKTTVSISEEKSDEEIKSQKIRKPSHIYGDKIFESTESNEKKFSKLSFPMKKNENSGNEFPLVSKLSDRWKRNLLKRKEKDSDEEERGVQSVERKDNGKFEIKGNRFLSPEYTRKNFLFGNKKKTNIVLSETPKNPSGRKFRKLCKLNKNQSDNIKTQDNIFFPTTNQEESIKKKMTKTERLIYIKNSILEKEKKKKRNRSKKDILGRKQKKKNLISDNASSKEFNSKSLTKIWMSDNQRSSIKHKKDNRRTERLKIFGNGQLTEHHKKQGRLKNFKESSMNFSHKKYFKLDKKKAKKKQKKSNRTQPENTGKFNYAKTKSLFKKHRRKKQQKSIGAVSNTITTLKSKRKKRKKRNKKYKNLLDPRNIFISNKKIDPQSPQSMIYTPNFEEDSEVFYKDKVNLNRENFFKKEEDLKIPKIQPRRSINVNLGTKRSKKSEFIRVKNFHNFGESNDEEEVTPNREVKSVMIHQIGDIDDCSAEDYMSSGFRNLEEDDGSVVYEEDYYQNDRYGSLDFEKSVNLRTETVKEIFSDLRKGKYKTVGIDSTKNENKKDIIFEKFSSENSPRKLNNLGKDSFEAYKNTKKIELLHKNFLRRLRTLVAKFELKITERKSEGKSGSYYSKKNSKLLKGNQKKNPQIDVYSLHNRNNHSQSYGTIANVMYENTSLKMKMKMNGVTIIVRRLNEFYRNRCRNSFRKIVEEALKKKFMV